MTTEKIKEYLQTYIDQVMTDKSDDELGEITLNVYDVVMGSYNPPMIHVFIDTDPKINTRGWDVPHRTDRKFEKDISDFFNMLSIPNKIKIHWDKRPVFKGQEKTSGLYGTQNKRKQ